MTKVAAIIVTYNAMRRSWADRCLQSLSAGSGVEVVPVVVDNGSTDGTRDYIPAHYPSAVWLPQEHNLGFGQANNVGIRYALDNGFDACLLLNQDACLAAGALEEIVRVAQADALYTPVHLNGDGTAFDCMFRLALLRHPDTYVDDLCLCNTLKATYSVGEICAACWYLPAGVVRAVGGFNPIFFHYGEDNNYYQRLIYHGYDTRLVPRARMMHDRNQYGDEAVYNHKLLRREALLVCCNINSGLHQMLKGCLRAFRRYRPRHWLALAGEMCWCALHARAICRSRRCEKSRGQTWL